MLEDRELNILILDPDPSTSLVEKLKKDGFKISFTSDIGKGLSPGPDFILLSPAGESSFFTKEIKKILKRRSIPLIYLGRPSPPLKKEIDDFLPLPLDDDYLIFKIRSLAQRIKIERDTNPLTGLPGNRLINLYLNQAYASNNQTIAYLDINDFKPYNDTYGFSQGDEVIRFLGEILYDTINLYNQETFLGHIGGDDFIMIGQPEEIDLLAREVIARFENNRNKFYSNKDMARGSLVALDREGQRRNFPLLSLSLVSFPVSGNKFRSVTDITQRAAYLKKWIKGQSPPQGKSIYFPDREDKSGATIKGLEELASSKTIPLSLRRSIIEALGELGDNSSFFMLKELLNSSESLLIRKSVIYALGRLKDPRAVAPLMEILSDPSPHLRCRAVEALGEIGQNEAYPPIQKLASDENNFVRQKVMLSLGKLANSDCYPFLVRGLNDPDKGVSENAIWALGEIKNPASLPFLKKFLKHVNPRYRSLAIASLSKIFHPEAGQAIADSLDDSNIYVQWQAISKLPAFIEKGVLKERHHFILDKLLTAAASKNDYLKRASFIAMGSLKDRRTIPALLKGLTSRNDLIRWSVVISLGKIADKDTIPYLLRACSDKDDFVRASSAWALGEIGEKAAIEPLRQALKDPNDRVRQSAASSIVKIILKPDKPKSCHSR